MMFSTLSIGVCCNCANEAFSRGISMDISSPQLFLIDLPHDITWQYVHKFDLTGRFVVRQRLAAVGLEGLCINIGTRDHKGFDLLAHTFGWNADDCRFDN